MKRKDAGSKPIWGELKQAVERFRATMPLIADLSNKDLRERECLSDLRMRNTDRQLDWHTRPLACLL